MDDQEWQEQKALTKPNLKNKEPLRRAILIDSSAALGMTS